MAEHPECPDLLNELSDYIDGVAREEICTAIEEHMAVCPDCRILVDTLRKTIYLYRNQEAHQILPEDIRQRLFAKLDLQDYLNP